MAVLFPSNIRPVQEMMAVSHPISLEKALGYVFQVITSDSQVHHFLEVPTPGLVVTISEPLGLSLLSLKAQSSFLWDF